ncbi:MAG: hypothetical protein U1F43_38475, partial [Myxococcota bacterium]
AVARTVAPVPSRGLWIELRWHLLGEDAALDRGTGPHDMMGSDLDLHLRDVGAGEWFDAVWDVYARQPYPPWGVGSRPGPTAFDDDTNGPGPELIALEQPAPDHTFEVGVHAWDDGSYAAMVAEVRVFIDGVLRYARAGVAMVEGDLWRVCDVAWPSAEVTAVGDGAPVIIHDYPLPPKLVH